MKHRHRPTFGKEKQITTQFSDEQLRLVRQLAERLGQSPSEILRLSLHFYHTAIIAQDTGGRLLHRGLDGHETLYGYKRHVSKRL